ncbi:dehydrogenase [Planctomycetales bacterium]|nr:dehydrogenase [Planctomycetales bacterium]GHT34921.1 dehydrogenase [Planctomycetales bacterium]
MKTKQTSRRNFLRTAAAVSAPLVLGLNNTPRVHAAGSGVIKVGLVGCGGRGLGAAQQALSTGKDVKLVAVGDYFKQRAANGAAALKKQFPEQVDVADDKIFDGFQNNEGVSAAGADVILIACAAKFHPSYTLHALKAGKHVFCEKPNAVDALGISVIEESVKTAKEKNLSFLCGLQSRFCPQYQAVTEQVHNGAIGDVKMIQSTFLRAPYGVRENVPAGSSELDFQVWSQYMFNWLSGDDFTQSLVHNVDRMTWLLNGQTPTHAFGMGGRASMTERIFGNVFDHHAATFIYPQDKLRYYAFCRTETGCYNQYDDLIIGTKGTVYWNAAKITGETNWEYHGTKAGGHAEEQVALFAGLRNGTRVHSDDYVIKSTTLAVLGQIAAYTGNMISWDEMVKSKFALKPLPEECKAGIAPPVVPDEKTGSYPVVVPGQTKFW